MASPIGAFATPKRRNREAIAPRLRCLSCCVRSVKGLMPQLIFLTTCSLDIQDEEKNTRNQYKQNTSDKSQFINLHIAKPVINCRINFFRIPLNLGQPRLGKNLAAKLGRCFRARQTNMGPNLFFAGLVAGFGFD
jgi:hypothetical protein